MDKKTVERMLNARLMRFFYFRRLPGAWFFKLKVTELNESRAIVEVPYCWRTQNPFQSIYFAALAAAAELSTGSIALAASEGKSMSMLVTNMEGKFIKKAKETIRFECSQADKIIAAIQEAEANPNGSSVLVKTTGSNSEKQIVAEFSFEWSFRKKKIVA
jgi:cellobiose-specific phosphotransferase system component IIB